MVLDESSGVRGSRQRTQISCAMHKKESGLKEEREGRGREGDQAEGQEQGKKVRFAEEEPSEEMRTQSTDEQDAMSGLEEVRTGRGSAGLVRGRR